MNDRIFESSISKNLPWGHVRSHKKFGPDRFSRFNVYLIQTNRHPDVYKQCICRLYGTLFLFKVIIENYTIYKDHHRTVCTE